MNTDDPHLKCHLMSQTILHICHHHHVVVLNLRCRRSCHNANENLRNYSQQPTSLASEPAWKVLALSSWLLLGRPAVNESESNCSHFLDARLEPFWAEDWSALWVMVRAECAVARVQNTTRRTDKHQMQSRVCKVATLARTGEKGRALAAAKNAPPVPVTEQIVQEIKKPLSCGPRTTGACASPRASPVLV